MEGGQGGEEEEGGRGASEDIKEVALFLNCLSVHQDYKRYLYTYVCVRICEYPQLNHQLVCAPRHHRP